MLRHFGFGMVALVAAAMAGEAAAQGPRTTQAQGFASDGPALVFNAWTCSIGAGDAKSLACRTPGGGTLRLYRGVVFAGELPPDLYFQEAYQSECGGRARRLPKIALAASAEREIDKLFPLAVGNKARYTVEYEFSGGTMEVATSDTVVRSESVTFGPPGQQSTTTAFVIERSGSVTCALDRASPFEFKRLIWFAPDPGVIVKEQTTLSSGSVAGRKVSYDLVALRGFGAQAAQTPAPTAAGPPAPAQATSSAVPQFDGEWRADSENWAASARISGDRYTFSFRCKWRIDAEFTSTGVLPPDRKVAFRGPPFGGIAPFVQGVFPLLGVEGGANCRTASLTFVRDGDAPQVVAAATPAIAPSDAHPFDGEWRFRFPTGWSCGRPQPVTIKNGAVSSELRAGTGGDATVRGTVATDGTLALTFDGTDPNARGTLSGKLGAMSGAGDVSGFFGRNSCSGSFELVRTGAPPPTVVAAAPASPATAPAAPVVTAPVTATPPASVPTASAPARDTTAPPRDTTAPAIEWSATVDAETGVTELSGRVTDQSRVAEVTIDGRAIPLDRDGAFKTRRVVAIGTATLKLAAVDEHGNAAARDIKVVRADTAPPVIETAGSLATELDTVEVKGRVSDTSAVAALTIEGTPVALAKDGTFAITRTVPVGASTLKLAALDEWGNRGEAVVAVTRAAPVVAAAPPPPRPKRIAEGLHFGKYHALVIGNNAYKKLDPLKTAVADAEAVSDRLKKNYGFAVTTLKNASRTDILRAMTTFRRELGPDDNLLIYYAGHGVLDDVTERGYWLPVDAERDEPSNWISNADVGDMLRAIRAKHVLVVADSCYAGTLVRAASAKLDTGEERRAWIERVVKQRARTALASGGLEPVVDSGGGKHSVFAKAFLDALDTNEDVLEGQALFDAIKRPVALGSDQTPRYADIRQAGHEGGDFLFVRK